MPYKDPERKREWEREHREERNARRRRPLFPANMMPRVPRSAHDPIPDQEPQSWQLVVGLAVGLGVVLFAALIFRWTMHWARNHTNRKSKVHDLQ